jgi:putative addiction module component
MGTPFDELEKQARALTLKQKAALARVLIDDLDASPDPGSQKIWIEEAQHRYDAFHAGEMPAHPGDEVMNRARDRLK